MGKSLSAKHLCGSNSLGPRFLSKRRMTWTPHLHLDVKQWLKALDLLQYIEIFSKYQGVEELINLTEGDIKTLGVNYGAHRAKIVSSLVYLKKKYEKSNRNKSNSGGGSHLPPRSRAGGVHDPLPPIPKPSPSPKENNSPHQSVPSTPTTTQPAMEPLVDPSASPQQLRKALEWELSLDSRDLRSHAWYHGTIPRHRAEELMAEDGDFLIRDCISQPGDYVLTCRWKGICLHFVINKVVIQPNTVYERIQFQFEDDSYDTVPDLVTFYVGSGKSISVMSGARICHPVNRSMPLTFYATKYGSQCLAAYGMTNNVASPPPSLNSSDYSPRPSPFQSPRHTPNCSPPTPRKEIPPKLPEKVLRTPVAEIKTFETSAADGTAAAEDRSKAVVHRQNSGGGDSMVNLSHAITSPAQRCLARVGSEPMLSPTLDRKRWEMGRMQFGTMCMSMTHSLDTEDCDGDKPPPKPSRIPSTKIRKVVPSTLKQQAMYYNDQASGEPKRNKEGAPEGSRPCSTDGSSDGHHPATKNGPNEYQNGSDSGNGSGDSVHSGDIVAAAVGEHGTIKRKPALSAKKRMEVHPACDVRFSLPDRRMGNEGDSAAEEEVLLSVPELERPSCFDLTTFATMMLTKENKPLDGAALHCVHSALLDTGSRVLANHLTRVDVEILRSSGDHDLGLGVLSGIELLTLPQGQRLRQDLLERLECLKLFVAITILTSMNETQRAEIVHKWIQVAIDAKTALGNLYGFTAIMLALGLPQIQRLACTWNTLRQKYTDSTLTYEAKLRPTFKAMNEGTSPQAPNTSIPHLFPLLVLLEQAPDISNANNTLLAVNSSFLWEATSSDYGIQLIHAHLDAGRDFVTQCSTYKRNAEIVLENVKFDDLLLDTFRTEFHLRFLWGTKGAIVSSTERHAKFQQVLCVMSERCEASS